MEVTLPLCKSRNFLPKTFFSLSGWWGEESTKKKMQVERSFDAYCHQLGWTRQLKLPKMDFTILNASYFFPTLQQPRMFFLFPTKFLWPTATSGDGKGQQPPAEYFFFVWRACELVLNLPAVFYFRFWSHARLKYQAGAEKRLDDDDMFSFQIGSVFLPNETYFSMPTRLSFSVVF